MTDWRRGVTTVSYGIGEKQIFIAVDGIVCTQYPGTDLDEAFRHFWVLTVMGRYRMPRRDSAIGKALREWRKANPDCELKWSDEGNPHRKKRSS